MKNWRTTLVGALIAGALVTLELLQNGSVDLKTAVIAGGIAVLSFLAKDFNISGTAKTIVLLFAVSVLASSCTTPAKLSGVEITRFEKTDSLITLGVHVFGKGQLSSNRIEIKYLDVVHSDTTFEGNILLNLKTK